MTTRARGVLLLLLLAGVTVPAVLKLRGLRTRYDVERFFPADDPEVARYNQFKQAFGLGDTSVLVLLTGQEVFSPAGVAAVDRLSRAMQQLDGVEQVTSLTTATEVRAGIEGTVVVSQPLGADYQGPASLPGVRRRLLRDPLFRDRLVSSDGRTTAILARLSEAAAVPERARKLERVLGQLAGPSPGGFRVLLGGAPLVRARYMDLIRRDLGQFMPLVLVSFAVLLALLLRGPTGVVLPLLSVGIAAIWCLGGHAALGGTLDSLSSMVPVILLVVGLSDALHLLARYRESAPVEGQGPALRRSVREVGLACVMTSVTTVVGFSVLALSGMPAVRTFGLLTAAGVVAALLATLLFLPAALAVLPAPRKVRSPGSGLLDRLLSTLTRWCQRRPWRVLGCSALLLLFCAGGAARVSREIRLYGNLPEGHPILQAERFADRKLGGALSMEVTVDGGHAGGATSPAAIAELERIERWLRAQPGVHATRSALDPLRAVHHIMTGASHDAPMPRRQDLIAQYLLLLSFGERDPAAQYLSHSRRLARVSAQIPDMGQRATLGLIAGIRRQAARAPAGISVRVTGSTAILHRVYRSVVDGLVVSFALAFGVIFVLLIALLRSLRLALISLVPNLIPMLAALGMMGWAGIALAPTTSLVFAVAFGIAVDDTIHFLAHYRRSLGRGASPQAAVADAMRLAGRPIIWTSLVLVVGFCVLLASSFLGNVYFGLITAATLAAALVADLLVLPALLVVAGRGNG